MRRRKWAAKTEAMIVIQGLQGKPVAEICHEYQIGHSLHYQWRNPFLAQVANAFELHQSTQRETRLEHENAKLKKLVGELMLRVEKKRRAAGMKRCQALRVIQHDAGLLPRVEALKAEHPFWGYRRIWAHLHFVGQCAVNKKRLPRLMREPHLIVPPNLRLKAKRRPTGSKPKPTKPQEWLGHRYDQGLGGGLWLGDIVLVLDWYTNKSVGHYAGFQCTASSPMALRARAGL
jgi:putative transposase